MIANNASAVKMKVFAGDNELENHPLISLLERPNPLQSGVEYFHSLIINISCDSLPVSPSGLFFPILVSPAWKL